MLVWRCFVDLHASRSVGMEIQPIAISEVGAWLDLFGITGEDRIEFFELVQVMDQEYLKMVAAKRKVKHG